MNPGGKNDTKIEMYDHDSHSLCILCTKLHDALKDASGMVRREAGKAIDRILNTRSK